MRIVVPVLFMVAFSVATRYCPGWQFQLVVVFWLWFSCIGRFGLVGVVLGNCL